MGNNRPDIVFYETFQEEKKALQKYLPRNISPLFTPQTIQSYGKKIPACRLISIRTQSLIPDGWAKQLTGILARTTGHDHLTRYLERNQTSIPCGYLPHYCSRAVAEQAVLLMLALMRKLPRQTKNFARFNRDQITGKEAAAKHLLVVGVGRIGAQVAALGKALGMEVKGVDLVRRERSVEYVSLNKGLSWADVIVCALPLTNLTRRMLDYRTLRRCRQGVFFINVSRGEISPAKDLLRLLKQKKLGGAGLDVFEEEDILADLLRKDAKGTHPALRQIKILQSLDNVILTPHNAFNTWEALERKAEQSAGAIGVFLKTGKFPDQVFSLAQTKKARK